MHTIPRYEVGGKYNYQIHTSQIPVAVNENLGGQFLLNNDIAYHTTKEDMDYFATSPQYYPELILSG